MTLCRCLRSLLRRLRRSASVPIMSYPAEPTDDFLDSAPVPSPQDSTSSDDNTSLPPLTHHDAGSTSEAWHPDDQNGSGSASDEGSSSGSGASPEPGSSSSSSSSSSSGSSGLDPYTLCYANGTVIGRSGEPASINPAVVTRQEDQPKRVPTHPCAGGCGQHTIAGVLCYSCRERDKKKALGSSSHAPMSAEELLERALATMKTRGTQYDSTGAANKERSIPRAVRILAAQGVALSVKDATAFMLALKLARLETATSKASVDDTLVDLLAYAALWLEAKAEELHQETAPLWS